MDTSFFTSCLANTSMAHCDADIEGGVHLITQIIGNLSKTQATIEVVDLRKIPSSHYLWNSIINSRIIQGRIYGFPTCRNRR